MFGSSCSLNCVVPVANWLPSTVSLLIQGRKIGNPPVHIPSKMHRKVVSDSGLTVSSLVELSQEGRRDRV